VLAMRVAFGAAVNALFFLGPEVVIGGSTQVTTALKEKARSIPIVFVHVADPNSSEKRDKSVMMSSVMPSLM
jgi:ABC-type uncharacterized transport system substrate-binding protein